MPRTGTLSVTVVPVDSALATLRDEWGLTSPEVIDDPTSSPLWLQVWWRHFGKPGTEQVLSLVTSDMQNIGFLFTRFETERYHHLPVRTVRCWVNSHAQRAALFLRCDADAAARALVEYWTRRNQWDLLRLQGLPEGEFTQALQRHAGALGCRCTTLRDWGHSRIEIRGSFEEYLRSALSRDTRKEVARQGRRLADHGTLSWRNHDCGDALIAVLDDFIEVERQSWKKGAGETIASDPRLVAFYGDVVRSFSACGMAAISVLRLNDRPIAATLGLASRRRLVTLKTSFDERLAKYSPGSQLYTHLLTHAFDSGFKELDFYGKMAFSERWTKDERCFTDLQIEGPTVRSRLIGLAWAAKNRWSAARMVGGASAK